MLPLLVKLQEEQSDIKVYKLNCNKKNKELGVKLNVKVAPTFQLYKNSNKVNTLPWWQLYLAVWALCHFALTRDVGDHLTTI